MLINRHDQGAVRAVQDAAEAVGRALASTVMIINPRVIVVGGELAAAGELLLDPMRHVLQRNAVASHHGQVEVRVSALGDSATVRGAAAVVLSPQHLSESTASPPRRATSRRRERSLR